MPLGIMGGAIPLGPGSYIIGGCMIPVGAGSCIVGGCIIPLGPGSYIVGGGSGMLFVWTASCLGLIFASVMISLAVVLL